MYRLPQRKIKTAAAVFYAQGCVRRLAALLHAPRAAGRESPCPIAQLYAEDFLDLYIMRI